MSPPGSSAHDAHPYMPPQSVLAMPVQDFRQGYAGDPAPETRGHKRRRLAKFATFFPALLTTVLLLVAFTDWLSIGGIGILEMVLIALVGMTFFWVCLAVNTSTIGLLSLLTNRSITPVERSGKPLNVALLVPIYNESTSDVFGNAAAMLQALQSARPGHRFSLFVLSDTLDPDVWRQEELAVPVLRAMSGGSFDVFYRRRSTNTNRKTGNLTDWIENWGGGYDAMLVLDADSLMSGEAILELSDEMAADPSAGLIQSCPQLFGAQTLFARMQQFANVTYGWLLAEGLAFWSSREGNYWGHNAIIRTAAFASSAGLPHLRTLRGEDKLILSHDFVEAGLLRRAGWAVRILPRVTGSYEETPATLVDYVLRDRRWCQGNMQHLRILSAAGLHPVSRFHLFHGAISYLLSPAWFALLTIWALVSNGEEANVISYFSAADPTQPTWPHMSTVSSIMILVFMYSMLLAPKLMGALVLFASAKRRQGYGGPVQFWASFLIEVVSSIAYAPIMMVQQTVAVARSALGFRETWAPQKRDSGHYPVSRLIRFHALELITGTALLAGMFAGLVSLWLLPIAISLSASVVLSALSGFDLTRHNWSRKQLGTPAEFDAPEVIRLSHLYRKKMKDALEHSSALPIAAE